MAEPSGSAARSPIFASESLVSTPAIRVACPKAVPLAHFTFLDDALHPPSRFPLILPSPRQPIQHPTTPLTTKYTAFTFGACVSNLVELQA